MTHEWFNVFVVVGYNYKLGIQQTNLIYFNKIYFTARNP